MIRVLMLVPNLRVANGVASFAMNYFRNLDHSKISMDFATYGNRPSPYIAEIEAMGQKVYLLPSVKKFREHYAACRKILGNHYDIVHDHSLMVTMPMMLAAKIAKVPARILHSHSSKMGETKKKEKRNRAMLPLLKAMANHYAACSDLAGKAMFHRNFTVIPNVIAPEKFIFDADVRNRVRQEMDVNEKYVIVTVGRVAMQKNPYFAMDVFQKVAMKDSSAEYWWIGSGQMDRQLAEYVKQLGLEDRVKLLGSRENIVDFYQAADCFFLPSLFEGLGIAMLEAQAMGLPTIASDVIPPEVAYTNLVRFVSLEDSVERWAEYLLNGKKEMNKNRDYHAALLKSCFSHAQSGDFLLKYYSGLLGL